MGCLALELDASWVEHGLSVGMWGTIFPGVRNSITVQSSGVEPPASGFQSQPLTVASRLLCPHNPEDKTLRLMVKQLPTDREHPKRFTELYREEGGGR